MTNSIEWDQERGRYVNRALERVQEVNRLAGLFRNVIVNGGDLIFVVDATLSRTPATLEDVVLALTTAVRDSAYNGDTESEKVNRAVSKMISEWLNRSVMVL